jgi:hypothetical protein
MFSESSLIAGPLMLASAKILKFYTLFLYEKGRPRPSFNVSFSDYSLLEFAAAQCSCYEAFRNFTTNGTVGT